MIKRVGIVIYKEFKRDNPMTQLQQDAEVNRLADVAGAELDRLLKEGYTIISYGVVEVPGLTFMLHVLYKPE